ncbi:MAG: TlpA family protein disulfide reductase [Rikenellaceae bacterium]|nr:TlpA family protein disulfide reductase [Rikenellaceae bacterium]
MLLFGFMEYAAYQIPVRIPMALQPVFPSVDLISPRGTVRSSELFGEYSLTLVDFRTSWCEWCRKSNPVFGQLLDRYAEAGFGILSVSIDKTREEWKELSREISDWPIYFDPGEAALLCKVRYIPRLILVDRHGNIVEDHLRLESLERHLEQWL